MKNKEAEVRWKNNMKICSAGEKTRNASEQQGENEQ